MTCFERPSITCSLKSKIQKKTSCLRSFDFCEAFPRKYEPSLNLTRSSVQLEANACPFSVARKCQLYHLHRSSSGVCICPLTRKCDQIRTFLRLIISDKESQRHQFLSSNRKKMELIGLISCLFTFYTLRKVQTICVISPRNYTYLMNFPQAFLVSLSNLCSQGQGDFEGIQT